MKKAKEPDHQVKRMPNIHPNGFWIYLLKSFRNGMRLRFHFWPRGSDRKDTPHDHRSWFISIPLWGRFKETRFQEADGTDREVLQCHATTSNGTGMTTPAGKGSVHAVSTHTRWPLIPYICHVGEIHSYEPAGKGPAASLVLFGPPKTTPRAWK